jgi:hypothetical protein
VVAEVLKDKLKLNATYFPFLHLPEGVSSGGGVRLSSLRAGLLPGLNRAEAQFAV